MTQNSALRIIIVLLTLVNSSCIEKFVPQIDAKDQTNYVISGNITNQQGYQSVTISLTSTVSKPEFVPVSGCQVTIIDNMGHNFYLNETQDGVYSVWIEQEDLAPGKSYQLNVVTPEGIVFVSDYDTMPKCPDLDSLYYVKEAPPLEYIDPNFETTEGIRFYTDFTGSDEDSRFLRWEIKETWEYHTRFVLSAIIDSRGFHYVEEDSSRMVCWRTQSAKEIFTLSTSNLSQNMYRKVPLNYVNNHSSRLEYGYYLVVKQHAISEDAFIYWEQLRLNSNNDGSLYETQPYSVKGNIHNLTQPDQEALGFFEASSVDSLVLFITNVENISLEYNTYCNYFIPKLWPRYSSSPIYITDISGRNYEMTLQCWDCLSRGGINIKPDFWPL